MQTAGITETPVILWSVSGRTLGLFTVAAGRHAHREVIRTTAEATTRLVATGLPASVVIVGCPAAILVEGANTSKAATSAR